MLKSLVQWFFLICMLIGFGFIFLSAGASDWGCSEREVIVSGVIGLVVMSFGFIGFKLIEEVLK